LKNFISALAINKRPLSQAVYGAGEKLGLCFENVWINNMVKSRRLAKSINDAAVQ
jgi:hypothetical protein